MVNILIHIIFFLAGIIAGYMIKWAQEGKK
jgi:hypothetical protein